MNILKNEKIDIKEDEKNMYFAKDICIKEAYPIIVKIKNINKDLEYDLMCENSDLEYTFIKRLMKYNEENIIKVDDNEEYDKYIVGYVLVKKLKFKTGEKKEVRFSLQWHCGDVKGEVVLGKVISTSNVYKKISLPLYYRPFYTNAVLLLTPEYMTSSGNYSMSELNDMWTSTGTIKPDSFNSEKITNCYGRLFYSISNGCSMVEDYEGVNIYKLNNVSLTCKESKTNNNINMLTIKKPFRCFSEMCGSKTENTFANDLSGVTETTKLIMYGITEPFNKKSSDSSTGVTKQSEMYFTKQINSPRIYVETPVRRLMNENNDKNYRSGTWTSSICYNLNKDSINVDFKWVCDTQREYGSVIINNKKRYVYKYRDTVIVSIKNKDKEYEDIAEFVQKEYSAFSYNFTKMEILNDVNSKQPVIDRVLGELIGNDDDNKIVEGSYNFECYKGLDRDGADKDFFRIKGYCLLNYESDIESITRSGVPLFNGEVTIEPYVLDEGDVEKDGVNSHGVGNGIKDIYLRKGGIGGNITITKNVIQTIDNNKLDKTEYSLFDTSKSLDFLLNITEGYPEGEDLNASSINMEYTVKFYDDINYGNYWVGDNNESTLIDPSTFKKVENIDEALKSGELEKGEIIKITVGADEVYYKVNSTKENDEDENSISYYCRYFTKCEGGLSVKGTSSENVRYILLYNEDNNKKMNSVDQNKIKLIKNENGKYEISSEGSGITYSWGKVTKNILNTICDIGCIDSGKGGGTTEPQVRYIGLNTNDYLGEAGGTYEGLKTIKYSGWKGMHTYLKTNTEDKDIKLCGKVWPKGYKDLEIDITKKLIDTKNNPQNVNKLPNYGNGKYYVMAICDNYTHLNSEEYETEMSNMYSIIKPHTSRFSIIKLYKLN